MSSVDMSRYAPPDDATVNRAIEDYARAVRKAYGFRVKGIYLFGSRARGDHTPDSDADIAVVLEDGDWRFWNELFGLSDFGYDILMETGADLHGYPVRESTWSAPDSYTNPSLIRSMRRDQSDLSDLMQSLDSFMNAAAAYLDAPSEKGSQE